MQYKIEKKKESDDEDEDDEDFGMKKKLEEEEEDPIMREFLTRCMKFLHIVKKKKTNKRLRGAFFPLIRVELDSVR